MLLLRSSTAPTAIDYGALPNSPRGGAPIFELSWQTLAQTNTEKGIRQ